VPRKLLDLGGLPDGESRGGGYGGGRAMATVNLLVKEEMKAGKFWI
jgi:hypothetical protein